MEVSPDSAVEVVGKELVFTARAFDEEGAEVTGLAFEWGAGPGPRVVLTGPGRVRVNLAGQGFVWARAEGVVDTARIRVAAEGEVKWRAYLGEWFGTVGGPALAPDGGTLYVLTQVETDRQSRLWAVRAADGQVLWSLLIDNAAGTYPFVGVDGVIYVVGASVYAVDPGGSFRWVLPVPTAATGILHGGAISDAGVLYAATGSELLALDVATRDTLWVLASPTGSWSVPPTLDPTVGVLYVSKVADSLHAVDALSGAILWMRADTFTVLNPGIDARHWAHGPVLVDGRVYWPIANFLEALTSGNEVLWLSDQRGCCSREPVVGLDGVLLWENGSGYEPRDPDTGEALWRDRTLQGGISWTASLALTSDNTAYLLTGVGLVALRATIPPEELWRHETNRTKPEGAPADWAPGMLGAPVIGADGTVYTYNADTLLAFWENAPVAETPWPIWRGDPRRSGVARR